MTINKTVENGKAVLTPEGRLDTVTAPEMESVIKEVLPGLNELTLDFAKLEYISSAGLRVLLMIFKERGSKEQFKITNITPTVMDIFEVTGFDSVLL